MRMHEAAQDEGNDEDVVLGVPFDELTAAMADVGNNWERVPLRHTEGREGWEDALVGMLKDVIAMSTLYPDDGLFIFSSTLQ